MGTLEQHAAASPRRPALIRTPDQRLRVFVSSTLEELAPERVAARAAIESLRLAPVMFELGARPYAPRDLYRAYLDQSHVFIGIYARHYGWVAPGETVSGLEDEYGLSASLPRLIYIKGAVADREPALADLLARIRSDDAVSYRRFETADELEGLIRDDLAVLLSERFEEADRSRPAGGVGHARLPESARTNLPVPRNPLIGRETELARTCELLGTREACLVTLTGPGGCGKSRLGLEAGLELLGRFEDGVFLVPLQAVRDPNLVIPTIAETLHVQLRPEREPLVALSGELRDADLLLVLDNFEQVVEAGPIVSRLLELCPGLAVLATSRTPLRIRGEQRLNVPPLPLPGPSSADLEHLSQYAAVALFIQRARGLQPDFEVTPENAPSIAEICHRLDGLPLAIELAAARLRLMAPAQLLARLGRRFDVLRGGSRDLPERQQTLRQTIDWSHDLLGEDARKVFRRLSVFAGGATLDAAEAVSGGLGDLDADALDVIASLVDDSMLTSSIGDLGEMRIGMLDTMREYAAEKLRAADGEVEEVRRAHAEWYAALAEQAEPHLLAADEAEWASRLHAEHANAREALEWAVSHDPDTGLRIAAGTWRFWEFHGAIAEAHGWFERLLALMGRPTALRARALLGAARVASYVGDYPAARGHASAALAIWRTLHDDEGIGRALHEIGSVALFEGDVGEARRVLTEALSVRRRIGGLRPIADSLANLGIVELCEGNPARAEELLRESLGMYEKLGERLGIALARGNLAEAQRSAGRFDEATSNTVASLEVFEEIGDRDGVAASFDGLAKLASAAGEYPRAVRLFGLASALREEAGTVPPALERDELEREIAAVRARLGAPEFDAGWLAGRRLTVREAMRTAAPRKRASRPQAGGSVRTASRAAGLAAAGLPEGVRSPSAG